MGRAIEQIAVRFSAPRFFSASGSLTLLEGIQQRAIEDSDSENANLTLESFVVGCETLGVVRPPARLSQRRASLRHSLGPESIMN